MEPDNLTIRLLQEIRDEVRRAGDRSAESIAKMDAKADQRFEVLETTLKDLAEQMVFLARGIKTALDNRGTVETRLSDAERRLDELEKRIGH